MVAAPGGTAPCLQSVLCIMRIGPMEVSRSRLGSTQTLHSKRGGGIGWHQWAPSVQHPQQWHRTRVPEQKLNSSMATAPWTLAQHLRSFLRSTRGSRTQSSTLAPKRVQATLQYSPYASSILGGIQWPCYLGKNDETCTAVASPQTIGKNM